MRVTDTYRIRTVIENLNASRDRMNTLQQQLATAKKINLPSDDPIGTTQAMRIKTVLESNEQYNKNIDDGVSFLTATEDALNDFYNILLDVKDLALKGANDSTTDREDLAKQLDLILENLLEVSNSKYAGKYIFGGTETKSQPFTLDENVLNQSLDSEVVTYRGNSKTFKRQINEHTAIDINLPGSKVFDMSSEGGVNIFQEIYDLRNNFKNNPATIDRQKNGRIA